MKPSRERVVGWILALVTEDGTTVVGDPRYVTRREFRIEKTKKPRWTINHCSLENTLHADDPFTIPIEFKIASDTRTRSIAGDQVARRDRVR